MKYKFSFRQPGRMVSMALDEGDAVIAGTVMARLDAEPYRQKQAAAQAELRAAEADLDKLRSGNRPQEIAQAQERVSQTQAAFREAERNFNRQNTLLKSGTSSQRTVDAARATHDQTAADLASAKAALSLAKDGFRSEDIAAGVARVAVAEAALAQARIALTDTELVAPSNGTVIAPVRRTWQHGGEQHARLHSELARPGLRARLCQRVWPRPHRAGGAGARSDRFLPQSLSRSGRFHLATCGIHPQDRGDHRLTHRSGLPAAPGHITDADEGLRQGMPVMVDVDTAQTDDKRAQGK